MILTQSGSRGKEKREGRKEKRGAVFVDNWDM